MGMSLTEDFQQVDGIGEVKATQLAEIATEHTTDGVEERELRRVLAMVERGSTRAAASRLRDLLGGE